MKKIYDLNVFKMLLMMFSLFLSGVIYAQDVTLEGSATCGNNSSSSGTWTVPCDVTSITVEVYGAGGGGGGGGGGSNGGVFNTEGGGGAGGGGYTTLTIDVTPGSTFSYTAGRGGCGGGNGSDFSDGDPGTTGGGSSFSGTDANGGPITLIANGGGRGFEGESGGDEGAGGTGGSASGGSTNTTGGNGAGGSGSSGGTGGSGAGPGGGNGGIPNSGAGNTYGGGGAGGGNSNGGNGAPGAVLITFESQGSITPDVATVSASCTEDGAATISNYDSDLTYNFFPSGPSVGAGGVISGATAGSVYTVVASIGVCTSDPSSPFSVDAQLEAPTVEVTGDLTVCEGAQTTLTASGASTYLWDDPSATTASDLTVGGGTYTVTGSNSAGCTGTATVTVTEVSAPTVDLGDDQAVCGQSTVSVDAGIGFATYLWSNGADTQSTDLGPGTQWVEVSDGTCTGSDTLVISSNPLPEPELSPSGTQVICDGGSITLDAGSGFANYVWAPNGEQSQTIQVTASGSYSVSVLNDAGCQGNSDTVTVTIENLSDVTILADGPLGFCEGDSVVLDAGAGYDSYLWSNGDITQTTTISEGGSYSVSGTSGGCTFGSDTVDVSVSSLQITVVADGTELSVDAGYVSYQWFLNGSPIPGATSETYVATSNGNFSVLVTDANGCTGTGLIEFTLPDGIDDLGVDVPFTVFPNPSEGQFKLNTEFSDTYSVVVYNAVGQKILEDSSSQSDRLQFNLTTSGTYLLQLIVNERVYHKKLVVE